MLNDKSDIFEKAIIVAAREYIAKNKDNKSVLEVQKIKQEKEERLKLFSDKNKFIETVTQDKKEYAKKIEDIDKLINDNESLKAEYYARNEKLPNKEKIFSVSFLVKILEKEREGYLEKIEESNNLISPKTFVKEKTGLEKEVGFLNAIFEKNTKKTIIEISKIFLNNMKEKIKDTNEENKQELVTNIYKIRYYRYIPIR